MYPILERLDSATAISSMSNTFYFSFSLPALVSRRCIEEQMGDDKVDIMYSKENFFLMSAILITKLKRLGQTVLPLFLLSEQFGHGC